MTSQSRLRLLFFLPLIFTLATVGFCQDTTSVFQIQEKLEGESGTASDTLMTVGQDTTALMSPDTSIAIEKEDQPAGFFSRLVKPIVLTGLIGGILYMLFTERGR